MNSTTSAEGSAFNAPVAGEITGYRVDRSLLVTVRRGRRAGEA